MTYKDRNVQLLVNRKSTDDLLILFFLYLLLKVFSPSLRMFLVNLFLFFMIADLLWSFLCGHQPLQEPAHLFREHHRDVQRKEET